MNPTNLKEKQVENLTLQLQEIEMLHAMFPGKEEMKWFDPSLLIDVKEYHSTSGNNPSYVRYLTFELNIKIIAPRNEELLLQISVTLPTLYPEVRPELSIKCNAMSKADQTALKDALNEFISVLPARELILLEIITWLQENSTGFHNTRPSPVDSKQSECNEEQMTSLWLYMHHIYSKTKRKDILNWSHELGLTGFSLPGKPGIVYVEGLTSHVDVYFDRLRALPWKRMTCKTREVCENRVFSDFVELCFQVNGARNNHMDFGQFYDFLVKHELAHMFKELFGVEGK